MAKGDGEKFDIKLNVRNFMGAQMQAARRVLLSRTGELPESTEEEMAPVHREKVPGLSTPARRRNYLRQNAGGELTGPQSRRLKHKMGRRKQAAIKRRSKRATHQR